MLGKNTFSDFRDNAKLLSKVVIKFGAASSLTTGIISLLNYCQLNEYTYIYIYIYAIIDLVCIFLIITHVKYIIVSFFAKCVSCLFSIFPVGLFVLSY